MNKEVVKIILTVVKYVVTALLGYIGGSVDAFANL